MEIAACMPITRWSQLSYFCPSSLILVSNGTLSSQRAARAGGPTQASFYTQHKLEGLVVCLGFAIDWAMVYKKHLVLAILNLDKTTD